MWISFIKCAIILRREIEMSTQDIQQFDKTKKRHTDDLIL